VFSSLVATKFLASHEVRIVNTLRDARLELAAGSFDLILLDDAVNDGRGEELIAEFPPGDRPMIIGVSAYDDLNADLVRAGADAACGKLQFSQIDSLIRSLQN
jgi:DNA-binding response OmpR family regulator